MEISERYKKDLTRQKYDPKASIAGLELISVPYFADDGGSFIEIARISDAAVQGFSEPFVPQQISMSHMMPGTVKAFHIHMNQDDVWFVPPHQHLLVNCIDLREGSETLDIHSRLILGSSKAQLLRIPAGVAHGAANVSQKDTTLFYLTSNQFSTENPDEFRLPWDHFGADLWELAKE